MKHRTTPFVTVAALAAQLNLDRSNLFKKVKREGVKTTTIPVMTDGGLQHLAAVPRDWADRLVETYRDARANRVMTSDPNTFNPKDHLPPELPF